MASAPATGRGLSRTHRTPANNRGTDPTRKPLDERRCSCATVPQRPPIPLKSKAATIKREKAGLTQRHTDLLAAQFNAQRSGLARDGGWAQS
jgi:hypothetical protein